jgi:hypothetical protein
MKINFSKAPTFTKAIIASAVFTIVYLASASSLPPCSDTVAVLNSGACIERQSFLHTASGWLALIGLVAAVLLLALKHKDSFLGREAPAAGPGRASNFCATCGTRIITGDRFCQGCGASAGSLQS